MIAFLVGNTITYCQRLCRANNIPALVVSERTLFTEYGYLIPTTTISWNVVDALDGYPQTSAAHCWFVDNRGIVREVFMGDKSAGYRHLIRRIPSGPGAFYYRCDDVDFEKVILAAYDIAGDSVEGIIQAIRKAMPISELSFHTATITDIQKKLARKKIKPLQFA